MLSESIISIGLAQAVFAAFVLATKRERGIADWILVACLLTIALKFVMFLVHQRHAEYFDLQFSMGLIPLSFGAYLYLYTVYVVDSKTRFARRDLLHAIPFLVLTALYVIFWKDQVDFTTSSYFVNDEFLWVRVLYALVVFTSIVVYTVLTFVKLNQYRKTLSQQLSYSKASIRLSWMNFIFILFVLQFTVYFVTGGINAFSYENIIDTDTLSHVALTIIAFTVSYFGLKERTTVERVRLAEESDGKSEATEGPTAKNGQRFSAEEAQALIKRLDDHMLNDKPYLDPELTLYDLATQVNMGKNDLTYLLNHHIGKNFFTYVNAYRLNEVISVFENSEFEHFTIMAVARDCGFNSKSTFNSLFKKHTGKTPSEYRRSVGQAR